MSYTGADVLECMEEATNYNQFLADLTLAHAKPGQSILDFGAGIGTNALCLAEQGLKVHCVEPDPGQAATLRKAGLVVHSDLTQVPDCSVDFAYSLNVLEHIADDAAALALLYAKMKTNGIVLLYVPAYPMLFSHFDRKVGHLRRYRRQGLAAKVRHAGFRVLESSYADSLGFFAALAHKLVGGIPGAVQARSIRRYDRLLFPVSKALDTVLGACIGKNVRLTAVK